MMSRTLSYAMPKKRQLGGIVGSTPQLSSPIPNVGGVTWMGGSPPGLNDPAYQRIMREAGGDIRVAKMNIDRVRAEKGLPSLYNPPPPMEEMPKKKKPDYSEYAHMEKGGYVKGPQPPHALGNGGRAGGTTDFGPGKGLGVIGGGNQGPLREVVTGGYGAQPAMPGRIGYRGTLKERPGSRPSGLAGFYAMQREANLGKANLTKTDPTTGLAFNPSEREISAQMKMVGEKYGPTETAMLGDYYNAGRTGDFARQQQAKDRIMARRQELATQRESEKWAQERKADEAMKAGQQPAPAMPSSPPATRTVMAQPYVNQYEQSINPVSTRAIPMNLESGGYAKSSPILVAPTNTGGRNPDGIPVKDAMAKLEHGGANEKVKPYIVNEKGEEAWQPDGEKPQLIPGKEKMVLFPKDGKVIPHGRTMEMAKKGKVEMPEHRVIGGNTDKSGDDDAKGSLAKRETYAQRKEKAKQASLRQFDKQLAEKMKKEDIDLLRKSILEDTAFPTGVLTKAPQMMGGLGTAYQAPVEEYQPPLQALYSINPEFRKQLPTYAEMGGELPEAYLKSWATMQPESAQQVAPEVEDELDKLTYQDLTPEVAAPKAPQVPNSPLGPEPITTDYLGNALKAGQELIKTPLGPVSQNRPIASPAPTPEQIKAQTGYTPEEMELLAQGQQMAERGIKQMSQPKMVDVGGQQRMMPDVVFESGGGIKGGKAFGPRVIEQQKPATINPGKIKDELGDVGTRLAKQKEDKEFMKRWESDLASGKAPETEKAFKKPMKLQRGGRTSGYAK